MHSPKLQLITSLNCSIDDAAICSHWADGCSATSMLDLLLTLIKRTAWSELSAARLRPRGGHQTDENLGAGAFSTLKGEARRANPKFGVCFLELKGKRWCLQGLAERGSEVDRPSCKSNVKIADFSKLERKKYSGIMRNQFLIPNFLFDFYSVRGSTGTRSNIGTRKILQTTGRLQFFASLVARVTKMFQLKCVIFRL